MYKSVALINRINCFFGTNWKAVTEKYTEDCLEAAPNQGRANLTITCVDTAKARFEISSFFISSI